MHYSILEKVKKTVSFLTLITFLITNISYASIDSNRNPKDTTLRVNLTFSSPEFDAFLGKAAENAKTKDGIDISHADSQVRIQQTIVIAAVREWRRQRETTAAIEENLRQAFPQLNLYEIVRVDNRGTFHARLGDRYVKITTKGIEESSAATFTLISSSIGKLKPDRGIRGEKLGLDRYRLDDLGAAKIAALRQTVNPGEDGNPFLIFDARERGDTTINEKTVIVGTGGGDCAGLNDFIASLVLELSQKGYKVLGIKNCYDGMVSDNWQDYLVELTPESVVAMQGLPSTVLGSCRRKLSDEDLAKIIERFKDSGGLVITGGNDHIEQAKKISDTSREQGIQLVTVGVPKSIDNDFHTAMLGFKSAYLLGRRIAARASLDPDKSDGRTVAVFEVMGRKSGSLTLESSKGCPYQKAVIIPEKKVTIDDIIASANAGTRNFFVSEGFFLSEDDPKLEELFEQYPVLRVRYQESISNPVRDAHGNPKLTGASLFVVGILEYFCGLNVERTSLTYALRGTSPQLDTADGEVFDIALAGHFAEKAALLVDGKESGQALTYPSYDATGQIVEAKPAEDVYAFKDLSAMTDKELADLGVLGISGVSASSQVASVGSVITTDVSLEEEARKIFYGINISTFAHKYSSCVEFREPSEVIVTACGKEQSDLQILSRDLRTIIEATRGSVLILIPERHVSFSEIAARIKDIYDSLGYVNVAISKDFTLDRSDEILNAILDNNPILRAKFEEEAVDIGGGLVRFEAGVSHFIIGLFKHLQFKSTRITDLGYTFKGLDKKDFSPDILSDDDFLARQGVVMSSAELTKSSRRQQVDSMDQIIVVPASNIINDKKGFEAWIEAQPANIAVVIISMQDEYADVRQYENVAYIKVVGRDIAQEYNLKLIELFTVYEDNAYFGGFKLGTPASLDEYKTVADSIASGV